jgi:hypothetical protein
MLALIVAILIRDAKRSAVAEFTHSAALHVHDTRGAHVASLYPGIDLEPERLAASLRVALGAAR